MGYCPSDVKHQVRGRIITPIYDIYGELVALSTRHPDEKVKNRFWHESFDKGSYLYGLFYAKDTIRRCNKVIVVEGEFDVAALHSAGFIMSVGVCGSAFTLFQVSLLSRYCSDFYLMFDGDESGRKAIYKSMEMYKKFNLRAYNLNFIPVFLPGGEDPDSFLIGKGRKRMKEKLVESKENKEFKGI